MTQQIIRLAHNAVHAKLLDAEPQLKREIASMLSYRVAGAEHSDAFKGHRWDGRSSFFDFPTSTFPAGFVHPVHSFLVKKGYRVQLVRKAVPEPLGPSVKECDATIDSFGGDPRYSYQVDTIERLERYGMMIARCATGCHAKGTEILMYDGTLKKVEDVVVGDALMGPDSRPRNVMALHRGREEMFEIVPTRYGESFVVNRGHILSLEQTKLPDSRLESVDNGRWIEVTVGEYLDADKTFRHTHKLHRSRGIEFENDAILPVEPYLLGLLLGDGHLRTGGAPAITSADDEIADYLKDWACRNEMHVTASGKSGTAAKTYTLVGYRRGDTFSSAEAYRRRGNPLGKTLEALGLNGLKSDTKIVPSIYKTASRQERLDLLAGLLDTDGHLSNGGFDFVTKSPQLGRDVAFVARSLGFGVSVTVKVLSGGRYNGNTYSRVHIAGNTDKIPTCIARKRADSRRQKKDVCLSGFTVRSIGEGDYYGFEVDEDNLYLMGDFTVTHNSGKSRIAKLAFMRLGRPTLFLTTRSVLMYQMAESFEQMRRKVGVMGDGVFEPRRGCNVAMVQTIAARLKNEATREQMLNILSVFEMVILEEAHESGGNEYYEILSACKNAHYRLALTATPFMRQDEEANMRLMAVAGPIGIEVTEEQLINSGILATPYFKIVPTTPVPKVKRTSSWLRAYEYGIIKNEGRNGHIVFEVKRATAMNLPAMVLIQRKEHGQILEKMMTAAGIRAKFIFGENSQDERKKALKQLGNGELQCLIGSTILDVGVDVPSVGLVVLAGGGKAEVAHRQRIGRGLRAKKKGPNVALVVDFDDSINSHLKEHAVTRENILRTTPGFAERILPPGVDFDFKKLGLM